MVTIAAAMATIAEPMSVLDRPPPPTANFINGGVLLSMLAVNEILMSTLAGKLMRFNRYHVLMGDGGETV